MCSNRLALLRLFVLLWTQKRRKRMKEENTCYKGQIEIEGHLLEIAKSEVKFLTTTFFCDTITDASGHVWQRVDDK